MQNIIKKLREISGKEFIQLTERGNKSIELALELAKQLRKSKVLVQNQGGWIHYKKAAESLKLNIIELNTDAGLIDLPSLELLADSHSVLLINSMPAYASLDNMQKISEICKKNNCLLINDISGSIGTEEAKIGDIFVCSFGKWKPINLEYGGFIATDDKDYYTDFNPSYFDESKYAQLMEKLNQMNERLSVLKNLRQQVLEDLQSFDIIHKDKNGINVIIRFTDEEIKERIINYCKENELEYVECPKDIRVNENAISIEVKRK